MVTSSNKQQVSSPSGQHASFDSLPDELHMVILDYLFQNDKLNYGLLGKKYNELALDSLFKNIGISADSNTTMPYSLRGGMTVVPSLKFENLVHSNVWKKRRHLIRTLAITRGITPFHPGFGSLERLLDSLPEYKQGSSRIVPLQSGFKGSIGPVELELSITDKKVVSIPPEIQKLSINFGKIKLSSRCQRNQLQKWSKNFRQLKSLRMWNLESLDRVITSKALNLQDFQTFDLEVVELGCSKNSWIDLSSLFNATKIKKLVLRNLYDREFIGSCKHLRSLGLFYECYGSGEVVNFRTDDATFDFAKDLTKLEFGTELVEFRTNVRKFLDSTKYLKECSRIQTISCVPSAPMSCYLCEDAIRFFWPFLHGNHPHLKFFQYNVEFNIVR